MTRPQLVAGNWGDNWDIHVGSVAITFERMKNLYFSQPYTPLQQSCLFMRKTRLIKTLKISLANGSVSARAVLLKHI